MVRPANPWLTEEVMDKTRKARARERWWRDGMKKGTSVESDRDQVRHCNKEKRRVLESVKVAHLNREINKALGKKSLFKVVDSFLIKKPGLKLPRHDSLQELVERFSGQFTAKPY